MEFDFKIEFETSIKLIPQFFKDVLFIDSGDPWNPSEDVVKRVTKMLQETHRVLTPGGLFISIAFGQVKI